MIERIIRTIPSDEVNDYISCRLPRNVLLKGQKQVKKSLSACPEEDHELVHGLAALAERFHDHPALKLLPFGLERLKCLRKPSYFAFALKSSPTTFRIRASTEEIVTALVALPAPHFSVLPEMLLVAERAFCCQSCPSHQPFHVAPDNLPVPDGRYDRLQILSGKAFKQFYSVFQSRR